MKQTKQVTDSAIASYLEALKSYPQLDHTQVVELFKKLEDTTEAQRARKTLIECNLRLVVSIAKKYKNHNIPIEDLIQEGNIGLMKSIERFDWKRGFRFSTYATWWVRQAIGQHVLKKKRIVRLPAHATIIQKQMIQAAEEYRDKFNNEPSAEELAEIIGASQTVVNATMHAGRGTVSLNTQLNNDSNSDNNTLENKIPDERPNVDPYNNVCERELIALVKDVLQSLSPKEAAILRLRFGLIEDTTNSEQYPITQSEIDAIKQGNGLCDD
jgi:RNA polymerase sigma factor (sigma-70 family)